MYDKNLHQDEIVIDLNVSYFGDAELSFSLNSIPGVVKNIELVGTLRVVLKSSVSTTQLIENIEITFLEYPTYDFELMAALAPLNMFMSGELLHSVIKEQLSNRLVFPNKIVIKVKESSRMKEMPAVDGVIRVDIASVHELDGFENHTVNTIIEFGKQVIESPKAKIDDCGVSEIHFECDFVKYADFDETLNVSVSIRQENDELKSFKGNINVSNLIKMGKVVGNFSLDPQGAISVGLTWFTLISDRKNLHIEPIKNSSLLEVFIDSVRKLPKKQYAAFVELSIENQAQQTSSLVVDSSSWRKHFAFFISDPAFETLTVKLIDRLTSNVLGYSSYNVSDLMIRQKMEHKMQAFPSIKGVHDSELVMSLKLRVLKTPS